MDTNNNQITPNTPLTPSPRRHRKPQEHSTSDYVRQWLNFLFMLGAVVGVCVYFLGDKTIGTYIVLVAIVVKLSECVIRVFNR